MLWSLASWLLMTVAGQGVPVGVPRGPIPSENARPGATDWQLTRVRADRADWAVELLLERVTARSARPDEAVWAFLAAHAAAPAVRPWEARRHLAEGRIDAAPLISAVRALDDAEAAFTEAMRPDSVKILIDMR